MQIRFIGHASLLVEANGTAILSDPWWAGPCFGAQWWTHPIPNSGVLDGRPVDYIYLSHGHHDHFHPGTLSRLDRRSTVLISSTSDMGDTLQHMGFTVQSVAPNDPVTLVPGCTIRIIPTAHGDTMMTINDGREVCVNANDALHALSPETQAQFVAKLHAIHPAIDYLWCGYGTASHFPNCYRIPGKDMAASAAKRQHHFNASWCHIVSELAPAYAFPFAADLVFFEGDLLWANEPVHNSERPTGLFRQLHPGHKTEVVDVAPGFAIDGHRIVADVRRSRLLAAEIERSRAADVEKANRYPATRAADVDELLRILRNNLARRQEHLETYGHDYRFLIRLRNSDRHIAVTKRRKRLAVELADDKGSYDVTLTTRAGYLRNCIAQPYGWEVLFVGSGCQIEYGDSSLVGDHPHRELFDLVAYAEKGMLPRFGHQPRIVYEGKQLAKRLLTMAGLRQPELDLYSLAQWTVYS